ncbi:MAG: precorrin-3B synthase [Proteobacteria bacterium]|nr:precorrin-3B synthase [Pseudomonadota bacterium]
MTGFRRRGYCPSLESPMETGDGLLLRLTPPIGGWRPGAVAVIAGAAERYGNAVIEMTSRGNLQLRGFRSTSIPPFVRLLEEAGVTEGRRVVVVGPLAGIDPLAVADPRPLASAIAGDLPRLAPKVSVVVDGGGALHLDGLEADIRLRAADAKTWHLFAGPAHLGLVSEEAASHAALALLRRLSARGGFARIRDLVAEDGAAALRASLGGVAEAPEPPARPAAEPIGLHRLRRRVALGLGAPFGRLEAPVLAELARAAPMDCHIRPMPGRALLVLGLTGTQADALRVASVELGLVTRPDDPRRRIAACPGAPDCASAAGVTREMAETLAAQPDLLPDDMLHLAGCPKGCAHPAPASITLVCQDGKFALVRGGTARSAPERILPADDIPSALERKA